MASSGTINDKRVSLLRDIIENLKNDRQVWEPVIKAADKYQSTLKLMMQSTMGLIDALNTVAEKASAANSATCDLGVGIHQIAAGLRQVEVNRGAVAKSLVEDLITPLSNNLSTNRNNAIKFEKEYLKDHKRIVADIKKAESDSTKAAKKGPEELKRAIARVSDTVKEMETLRQNKLREAIVEERKRYCFFIMHFATVMNHDTLMHETFMKTMAVKLADWTQLAVSPDSLPPAVESLVTIQQRTFVPIQPGQDAAGGGYSSYYEAEEYEESPQSGSGTLRRGDSHSNFAESISSVPFTQPPSQAPQDGTLRPGDKCKALYDYQGEADKLSFHENDTIAVQEVDPSGWCLGSLNGVVGWFPSNYVEKVRAPAPTGGPQPRGPPMMAPQQAIAATLRQPTAAGHAWPQQQSSQQPLSAYHQPAQPQLSAYSQPASAPAVTARSGSGANVAPPPPSKTNKYGSSRASNFSTSDSLSASPPPPPAPYAAPAPPPPPPVSGGGSGGGGGGGRGALLSQIQNNSNKGGLRKVQTNDRSGPKLNMK